MARDLFKKMEKPRDIFHAKMGTIKDKNDKDLIEAEEIKKWQDYTEELNGFNAKDNHNGMVTNLEQDIWNMKLSRP